VHRSVCALALASSLSAPSTALAAWEPARHPVRARLTATAGESLERDGPRLGVSLSLELGGGWTLAFEALAPLAESEAEARELAGRLAPWRSPPSSAGESFYPVGPLNAGLRLSAQF
jgi:hypothetical protein